MAESNVFIADAIVPLGVQLTEYSPVTKEMAVSTFSVQVHLLVQSDIDLVILETFSNTDEILAAIEASIKVTDHTYYRTNNGNG